MKNRDASPTVVLAGAFRLLFLLASGWAVVGMLLWLLQWQGVWTPGSALSGPWWHGHEMVFGVVGAAAAGFLLTATPNWTGTPPRRGAYVALMGGLWLLARVAGVLPGSVAPWLAAAGDQGFLLLTLYAIAVPLWRDGNIFHRLFPIPTLGLLLAADAMVHAEALGLGGPGAGAGLYLGIDTLLLLAATLGGRLLPKFTTMVLQRQGIADTPPAHHRVEGVLLSLLLVLLGMDQWDPWSPLAGWCALLAGMAMGVRWWGWRPWLTWRDPMMVVLHAGFCWLAGGLLLRAAAGLGGEFPLTAALHGLTVGAMGLLMAGVMVRVVLAHTGRPVQAPAWVRGLFLALFLAALVRSGLVPLPPMGMVHLSGTLWLVGWLGLVVVIWPKVVRPRVDGKPG